MKKHSLTATKRTVIGKQVKKIRRDGFIPATIYGKKIESVSVSVKTDEFKNIYQQTGETGLIELSVDKVIHPVLIHNVQTSPVNDSVLHIEFYHVDLKEKVKANVPVELVGESQVTKDKVGVLLQVLNDVEVEALPTDLPEKIEISIESLKQVNDDLKVSDLKVTPGVQILTDNTQIIVRVAELVSKETEADTKAAEAAEAAAKAEGAGETGTEPKAPAGVSENAAPEKAPEASK
jgi:large subunit ribosomal protein L25